MQIEIARGRVALAHENFTEALRAFNTVLALAPGTIPALWGRGEAYRRFGDAPSARVDLLRVLQQDSKNLQALESLKQVAIENSQWNEAAATERRIIDASPQSSASDYAQLAEMLLRAGNVKDAYDAMQACLARDPYNLQTRLSLAELFDQQKNWNEAREQLEFARRYFPDGDPEIYTLLHDVYAAMGDSAAANEAVAFGLRIFPNESALQRLSLSR